MSRRVFELLRVRCGTRKDGWVFPSNRTASGHLCSIDRLFRERPVDKGLLFTFGRRQDLIARGIGLNYHSSDDLRARRQVVVQSS